MSNRLTNDRLAQGIAAAKAGDRAGARVHFEAAAEERPGDPVCWVWLAWTAPTPADAVFDLQKAASLSPDSGIVWKGLEFAQVLASSPKLDRSLGRGRAGRTRTKGRTRPTARAAEPSPSSSAPPPPPAAPAAASPPPPALNQRPVPTLTPVPVLASPTPASVFAAPPRSTDAIAKVEDRPASPLQERVIPWDDSTPRERLPEFRDRADKPADWARSAVAPSSGFGPTSVTAVAPSPRPAAPKIEGPARSSDGIPAVASSPDGERKPHVLVVDDSPTVCRVVTIALSNRGFEVTSAGDGVEAITMVSQRRPDLVLLDITMPKLDGYKVCKLIRGRKETREVPIVMLSGNDGFFDQARGKFAGCTSFLSKPFEPDDLIKEVEKQLSASMAGAGR